MAKLHRMDLENILNKISSPRVLDSALDELKDIPIPKISPNILRLIQNVLRINNKDMQQFSGLLIAFKIFNDGLNHQFTDADWLKLHADYSKSVILTFDCVLQYRTTVIIKNEKFCKAILDISKLLFPIVSSVDSVRSLILQEGFSTLSGLICLNELNFMLRKEIIPLIKPILVKSNSRQRKFIMDVCNPLLCSMAKLIIECGDYETQEDLTEILMRFSYVSKHKLNRLALWFQNYINDLNIIQNLDYGNFDTSCRDFLNTLNSASRSKMKVITLACLEVFANDLKLRKPITEKYRELWVDFSISTGSVHIVCDGGKNGWSRLIISQHNVKRVTSSKRVMHDASCAEQFLIELITPLSVFLNSSEKYIATVTILFLKSPKISELQEVFFKKCYREAYEEEKLMRIQPNAGRKNVSEITSNKECFFDGVSSISSIHTPHSHDHKFIKKAIKKDVNSEAPIKERPFPLVTSTPKVPSHTSGVKMLKIGILEGSHLKPVSESNSDDKLSFDEYINKKKWGRSSLVKYMKNPITSDDDRKFKEICETKLSQIRSELSSSSRSQSQSEATQLKTSKFNGPTNEQDHYEANKYYSSFSNKNIKLPVVKPVENRPQTTTNNTDTHQSEDDSPFTLSIKPSKPSAINSPNLKKQENVDHSDKATSDNLTKLQSMKKLFTENTIHNSRFSLQNSAKPLTSNCNFKIPSEIKKKSAKPSSSSNSNLKISNENKKNACVLQPSKLNILNASMGSNKPKEGFNLTCIKQADGFQTFSQNANSLMFSSLKPINKTSCENKVIQHSQNLFLNTINSSKKVRVISIPEDLKKNKKNIENISCSNKDDIVNDILPSGKEPRNPNSNKEDPISVCEKTSSGTEMNSTKFSKELLNQPSAKKIRVSQFGLFKLNKSDIYEWNSSRSISDEGSLYPSFKLISNNNKLVSQKAYKNNLSMAGDKKDLKVDQDSSKSNVFEDIELLSSSKNKDTLFNDEFQRNKNSLNDSLHCRIPNKTYGINKQTILNSTADKMFENIKKKTASNSEVVHNKTTKKDTRKRKLFNPNDSLEEVSQSYTSEEKNMVNLSPAHIKEPDKSELNKLKRKKQYITCQQKVQPFSKSTPQKKEPRRSLRLKNRVKFVHHSSDDTSSECNKLVDTNNNCGESSKKTSGEPENTGNTIISLDEINKKYYNSDTFDFIATRNDKLKQTMNIAPTVVLEKLDLRKRISGALQLESYQLSKEEENPGLVENVSKTEVPLLSDDIREETHCKLSLQGIPAEEGKSDDSLLELIEPPLRMSTDNSAASFISPSNPDPLRADSIGTQADARAELAFLDNVISELGQLTIEGPRKKILTETGSLERTINKVVLFTHTSNKNFSKKFIELKNNLSSLLNELSTLTSSHDDFVNSLGTKMADVTSTINRLSKNIDNDQESKIKIIEDIKSLCKNRRIVVMEERLL